ncbi:MAG: NAD(P)-dependent oxidoreductase [Candidatus Poribacteria bacterium]|nr:NAD(P)-dependent oxidoreductase [Candidatus Poribacteria bacterium]
MERKKVLITGAAGFIGSYIRKAFGDRYVMRLADITEIDDPQEHEVIKADITDLEQMRSACEGMDTVVHLAADRSPRADFYETLLSLNLIGTYNVFQAAKEQGCQRVVFASSVNAMLGYPAEASVGWDMPVNPTNVYGVTKCFGEALGRCYAHHGLSSIAIRIGGIKRQDDPDLNQPVTARSEWSEGWISQRDLAQLIQRCIDVEGIDFAIVHGQSRHKQPRLDISHTCEILGYEPQDGTV